MECSKASQEFVDNKTHKSTARQPQKMEKQRDHLGLAGFCSQSFTTKSLIECSQCIKDPTVNTARQEGCQPGFCANKRAACLEAPGLFMDVCGSFMPSPNQRALVCLPFANIKERDRNSVAFPWGCLLPVNAEPVLGQDLGIQLRARPRPLPQPRGLSPSSWQFHARPSICLKAQAEAMA